MPQWWSAAAKALQSRPQKKAQTYRVRCVCGAWLSGERSSTHQTVGCPKCERTSFVLPATVYPILAVPQTQSVEKKSGSASGATVAESTRQTTASTPAATSPRTSRKAGPKKGESPAPQALPRARPKLVTPLRLVVCGIGAISVLTVWWIVRSRNMEHAAAILTEAVRKGHAAIAEDDFPEAARQFSLASNAVDTLGRDDSPARLIRQFARESTAISQLSLHSMHDLLREAASIKAGPNPDTWPDVFRATYRDMWIVLDANITRTNVTPESAYQLDCPIVVDKDTAEIVANLPGFEALSLSDQPRRVIFAAQLDDCRLNAGNQSQWQIVLRPETGFLWSNPATLRTIGFPMEQKTESVLAEQSERLGVKYEIAN